ncbi:MAG: hypothetical protein Q4A07_09975 [Coriobacteriales bacterium]|nr:hypothetical protein [Coriobacteriales bacterium]
MLAYPEEWETIERNGHLRWVEVTDGQPFCLTKHDVVPHRVTHAECDAYGYVVSSGPGASVGFSGDASWCPGVSRVIADSRLAFVDCSFAVGTPSHMGCTDYQQLCADNAGRCKIVPTHMGDDSEAALRKSDAPVPSDGAVFHV